MEELKKELAEALERESDLKDENKKLQRENKSLQHEVNDLQEKVDENSEYEEYADKFEVFKKELICLGIRTKPEVDKIIKLCSDLFYK